MSARTRRLTLSAALAVAAVSLAPAGAAWAAPARPGAAEAAGLAATPALNAAPGGPAARSASASTGSGNATVRQECSTPTLYGYVGCMALVRTDVAGSVPSGGYTPADLQSAYNVVSAEQSRGAGETVALIEAYDDPNAANDLAAYRSQFGLPMCAAPDPSCLTQVNEYGQPSPLPPANAAWAAQESMDADMVAAICPLCRILVVEAGSPYQSAMEDAVHAAVAAGAQFVSMGWGRPETAGDNSVGDNLFLRYPGIAFAAAAGDSGAGAQFPAASQYVTAVGGTTLTGSGSSWTQTAWSGTGGGCSSVEFKPAWQTDSGCAYRTQNDVAAVADPSTGVAFYDSYSAPASGGWGEGGGTNVSSAIVAAIYALAGPPAANTWPASYPYLHPSQLTDVTSGADGSCSPSYLCVAGPGYDGPTGLGTPDGTGAFALGATTGDVISLSLVGGSLASDTAVVWAMDSAGQAPMTLTATGLPPGQSIFTHGCGQNQSCYGTLSGAPTQPGTYHVTMTATDGTKASGSITYTVIAHEVVTLTESSTSESGVLGSPVPPITFKATDSEPGQSVKFAATGLPPGLSIASTGPLTGEITGTPTASGMFDAGISATDTNGQVASGYVSFVIYSQISIVNPGTQSSTAGAPALIPLQGTDSTPGYSPIFSAAGLPPGVSVQPVFAASGPGLGQVIAGAPTRAGAYHVTLSATDGLGAPPVTAAFTWNVAAAPDRGPTGAARLDLGGKCLNDVGDRSRNGTPADIWSCNGSAAQQWTYAQDGTLRIHGRCLTAPAHLNWRVRLEACGGAPSGQWRLVYPRAVRASAGGIPLTLENPATGWCLTDPGWSKRNGTDLKVSTCDGYKNEAWTLPAMPVASQLPGKCMNDFRSRTRDGNPIDLWSCDGAAAQRWTVQAGGTVRVHGRCLGAANSYGYASIVLSQCTGSPLQQWRVSPSGALELAVSPAWCVSGPFPTSLADLTHIANGTRLSLVGCGATQSSIWYFE